MVAAQQEDALGVLDLQREEQADGLDPLPPPVDVVPQEQVRRLGREPPVLEEPQHVVVLAVHVPADFDRGADFDEHGLREEDGLHAFDESENIRFPELD